MRSVGGHDPVFRPSARRDLSGDPATGVLASSDGGEGLMRMSGLAAIVLSGWINAAVAEPIASAALTPAGLEITIWCARFPDPPCRARAAAAARARCGEVGARARFLRSALLQRTITHGQEGLFL